MDIASALRFLFIVPWYYAGDRIALPIFQQKAKKAIRKAAIHCGARFCGCIFFVSNRQDKLTDRQGVGLSSFS